CQTSVKGRSSGHQTTSRGVHVMAKAQTASAEQPRVGFIGVGLMGHGMARNILKAGYPTTVMGHRNRAPVEDLKKRGAREARTPRALAATSDVIFICVTSSVQV